MEIQERIKKLGKYFLGMNVVPDENNFLMYVEVSFPQKWLILKDTTAKYNVEVTANDNNTGYYFWSSSDNENNIFSAVEANIKVNEDAEAKVKLLLQKIEELKSIFSDETMELSTLETLEFKFTPKPKSSKKIKEIAETVTTPAVEEKEEEKVPVEVTNE